MRNPIRTVCWSQDLQQKRNQLVSREWLVTAENGSYASGTLGFVPTRRHHGLLIANLPAPQGRTMSLVQLRDEVAGPGLSCRIRLWGVETSAGAVSIHGQESLTEFRLECGFPVWTYQGTVWSWLIGPLVRAWVRTFPDRKSEAMPWLVGLEDHLGEACIGQISEVFEGDAPHDAVGCFAQAWSVAELLLVRRRWFADE